MIKCNVTACGIISNSAVEKQSKDGASFISFSITIPIAGSDGSGAELQVFVSAPGNKETARHYSTGRRVRVSGTLYIRRIDDRTYYNLRTDGEIEIVKSTEADALTGAIEFKGKIKDEIKERISKNGHKFQTFSGVSQDKDGEKRGWLWVRFLVPTPIHQDFFKPDAYVSVSGELQLHIYQGNVNIECCTSSIEPWELNAPQKE
uniref:Single-stranded DNA-binding protein n=1 Tax=Prevotella sp. GTC17254 TaxID=3236794 RepID=A0AB33IW95_9BACT